jgi:hypothetical protein
MHLLFYCYCAKNCWGSMNFHFADHLSIQQIFQAWSFMVNVEFSLDIFVLLCWAKWTMRNDAIFRNKNPSIQDCKRYLTVEVLLLLHRCKARIVPLLESWINSNL